jgi:hypothetical protein
VYWYNPYYNNDPYNHWCYNSTTTPGYYNSYDYSSYYYGPRLSHAGINPVIVNPSDKKMKQEGSNDGIVNTTAPAPYDPDRFNTVEPMKNVNTQNYQTPSSNNYNTTSVPEWDSQPVKGYGGTTNNSTTPVNQNVNNSTTANTMDQGTPEPKQGFWGKVLTGNKNTVQNNSNYSGNDALTPDNTNSNSGNGNASPKSSGTYTPKAPRNTNTYTPAENNSNSNQYTPKNNTTTTPPPAPKNNGGNSGSPKNKPR